jgi:hypothetical protein
MRQKENPKTLYLYERMMFWKALLNQTHKKEEISINYHPGRQVPTLEASLLISPKQQTDHSNE